jgi:hypothetical protein
LPLPRSLCEEQISYNNFDISLVIAAPAAIHATHPSSSDNHGPLEGRLRGNDEGKVVPRAHTGSGAQAGCAPRCISLSQEQIVLHQALEPTPPSNDWG